MLPDILHIHKNRLNTKTSFILLLIPPIVFIIIVTAIVSFYRNQYSLVLGNQAANLDIEGKLIQK